MTSGIGVDNHVKQSLLLNPEAYIDFFEIQVNPNYKFFVTTHPDISWNHKVWENFPVQLTGDNVRSGSESIRPQLKLGNIGNLLSIYLSTGQLYQGSVRNYRVLRGDLDSGNVSYITRFWDITRILTLTKDFIELELRSPLDRHDYTLPARQYFPPEFPYVKIG